MVIVAMERKIKEIDKNMENVRQQLSELLDLSSSLSCNMLLYERARKREESRGTGKRVINVRILWRRENLTPMRRMY